MAACSASQGGNDQGLTWPVPGPSCSGIDAEGSLSGREV